MAVIHVSSVPSFCIKMDASEYIKAVENDTTSRYVFVTNPPEPVRRSKSRKPKSTPRPVDPVWQKKRKKLLAALRRKKL